MAEAAKWYVVHTYSGYENTVKATIEKTIETRHLEDLIHIVSIPMETVTEITDNGPKTYDRKVFPGYVLIKMIMSDEAWYIVKNVRGVTGFVGKVNMDRNGGENLQETTEESIRETLRWLAECSRFTRIKPILTPRFTPACSDELMAVLGKISAEKGLYVHTYRPYLWQRGREQGSLHPLILYL